MKAQSEQKEGKYHKDHSGNKYRLKKQYKRPMKPRSGSEKINNIDKP